MSEADRPLVERTGEIATLTEAVARTVAGRGGSVSVEGGAGLGKTTLLEAAARLARERRMTVLEATASPLERGFSFGVARQLLERPLERASEATRERLLEGAARLATPALGIEGSDRQPADPSFGLLHGLFWLVANLSVEGPTLLSVDDVQWADRASLRFLAYLARRLGDLPVLLVTTHRTGEPEEETTLLAELAVASGTARIVPPPLSEAGTREMLRDELGGTPPPELVDRLHAATAGNPFLLRELAREAALGEESPGGEPTAPPALASAIVARLRRLGPAVVAFAEATMVLGDGCSLAEATDLAALAPEVAAGAAASLVQAQILVHRDELHFVHPLVRAAIESELAPGDLAIRHRRAAELLVRRAAGPDRIVAQLLEGIPDRDPEALALLRTAGRGALRSGEPSAAVRYLRRALEEAPPEDTAGELLTDLGVALVLADRAEEAVPLLGRARRLAADPMSLADRTLKLWLALRSAGMIDDGVAALEGTIDQLGEDEAEREASLLLEGEFVTAALLDADRLWETWRRLEPFESLPGRTPAERKLLSLVTARSQFVAARPAQDLAAIARRAYGGGRLITENPLDPSVWVWAVAVLATTDHLPQAEEAVAVALASAQATGSLETLLMIHDLRSYQAMRLGRVGDAEAEALEGLSRLSEIEGSPVRDLHRIALTRLAVPPMIARDRAAEADRLLVEQGLDGDLDGDILRAKLHRERGLVRLAQGRDEEALGEAMHLAAFNRRFGIEDVVEAPWRPVAALANARLGRSEEARTIADEHLALVRRWNLPRDLGVALRLRALTEPDHERRLDLLRDALRTLAVAPAPLELAETQAEMGRTVLRAGRRSEARDMLGQALDGATRCGATALAEMILGELKVAGARPRRQHLTGIEALTGAERRTAEMAATGLTNREIAQALFLSVRTVENNLGRAYGKLGISSRRDLAAALGGTDGLSE